MAGGSWTGKCSRETGAGGEIPYSSAGRRNEAPGSGWDPQAKRHREKPRRDPEEIPRSGRGPGGRSGARRKQRPRRRSLLEEFGPQRPRRKDFISQPRVPKTFKKYPRAENLCPFVASRLQAVIYEIPQQELQLPGDTLAVVIHPFPTFAMLFGVSSAIWSAVSFSSPFYSRGNRGRMGGVTCPASDSSPDTQPPDHPAALAAAFGVKVHLKGCIETHNFCHTLGELFFLFFLN
ncbi:uncharacterized protein LOC111720810 [Sarcophilus harrisii]|uniref:uncharacterized protein LOC111720810 n=1 Tax=Sarcophilus harrisii TaxID=9305 RepID=UPI000C7C128A|nr:uncharacterized protein LOC111720810 [Sarcophilus harrisii]